MAKQKPAAVAADGVEPAGLGEAAAVPAEKPGGGAGEKTPPPPFGTAKPAGPGALPRVVPELARADKAAGEVRFKIDCRNYQPQPRKYVLAEDEASAVA